MRPHSCAVGLLISGCIGVYVAEKKGREEIEGFLLGAFLGPIGCIIEGLLPENIKPSPVRRRAKADSRILSLDAPKPIPAKAPAMELKHLSSNGRPLRKCLFCTEMVVAEAIICRYCQHDLPPLPAPEPDSSPATYFAHVDN